MKTLNSVLVQFENPEFNYETNVSYFSTKESTEAYFVGKMFDVGAYPVEDMQKCVSIVFTDNN